jgi:hypothetical protein
MVRERIDILSLCILRTTKDIDAMDAIKTVWRFECSLSKCDIPFYSGSVSSSPMLTSRNCAAQRSAGGIVTLKHSFIHVVAPCFDGAVWRNWMLTLLDFAWWLEAVAQTLDVDSLWQ